VGIYAQLKGRIDDILFLRANSQAVDIGFFNKIRMWRRGFVSEAYLLHSFHENDPGKYVSDLVRLRKACRFNGYFSIMLMDKLYLAKMLNCFAEHLPVIYGLIRNRRWHRLDGGPAETIESVADLCRARGAIVIKPIVGTCGADVLIVRSWGDGWMVNRHVFTREGFVSRVADLDGYLATEFVYQHSYAAVVYPESTNTVRILTLWDDETDGPFIAAAVHRFGTQRSAPVDNWTAGGLSAMVDVETGRIGKAVGYPEKGRIQTFANHPETLRPIEGTCVPAWSMVKSRILAMARTLPFVPYIGWDLVVTADGFKVIEGNNCPGINLIQVHLPLLKDSRIRRFYEGRLAAMNGNGQVRRNYKLPIRI
jgi:hypothetical protein